MSKERRRAALNLPLMSTCRLRPNETPVIPALPFCLPSPMLLGSVWGSSQKLKWPQACCLEEQLRGSMASFFLQLANFSSAEILWV